MSEIPFRGVETPGRISLHETLVRLHAMLGQQVKVETNDYGYMFGAGVEGTLLNVEAVASESAISAAIGDPNRDDLPEGHPRCGGGFFLDFDCVEAFVVNGGEELGSWLEFRRAAGPALTIQLVDRSDASTSDAC